MTLNIVFNALNVVFEIGPNLKATGEKLMSVLSDAIAAATASADAAISRVSDDVEALTEQIAELQAQVAAGGASPTDIQALKDLQVKLDALDPTQAAVLPS